MQESDKSQQTPSDSEKESAIHYIDGMRFNRALRAGIRRVISKKEYLNKINVFPVPDGDTGTNMAFTLNSIRSRLAKLREKHVGRTLTQIADSAIDGARGNSGAILAQFFQGLSDATAELKKLSSETFAKAVKTGADYARLAMSEPKEGTILTVVQDFAKAIENKLKEKSVSDRTQDVVELLEHGLVKAKESLAATPEKLEVLRKSGVVDAGAQGFVELIEGITDFIRTGNIADLDQPMEFDFESQEADIDYIDHGDIEYRFCTECVIVGADDTLIDHKLLRETLNEMGNSVVVAGSTRKTKVHIHTNEPNTVFQLMDTFGVVQGQKADDMQQQAETAHHTDQDVIVVTDSAADIPEDVIDNLNIHIVPVRIHFGNTTLLDKVSLTPKEFYTELASNPNHPKTSQPTPGDFRRQFEYLGSHFKHVVYIGVTSKVSGTYQSAKMASERVETFGTIHLVDSKNASNGQGLVVMRAAEMAQAGESIEDILNEVENVIANTKTFAYLGNLDYAVKGGRVPKSKKTIATFLRLNPILATLPDGQIKSGGVLFGNGNRPNKFLRFLNKKMTNDKQYQVLLSHADQIDEAEYIAEQLNKLEHIQDVDITDTGTAIGCHGGPGTVVISFREI